jgi:hypothetical protein
MFKEKCWTLLGFKFGKFLIGYLKFSSEGENHSVEFDWKIGLSKFLLGWFHTHPSNTSLVPSQEDCKTSRGWVRALAKPIICGIMYENSYSKFSYFSVYVFKRFSNQIAYQPILKSYLFKRKIYFGILEN